MKIARIVYEWPPPWLGLAPAPYEMTKAQLKKGHEIDLFCGRWPKAGPIETLDNLRIHPTWRAPIQGTISLTSSILMFFEYLKVRKKSEFDIIHAHGHFAVWIFAYRNLLNRFFPWAKEVQTPIVAHFHNTVRGRKEKLIREGTPIKAISEYLDWPLAEFSDRAAIRGADALIFVSEDLKNEAIEYYKADPKKCFVIESGVNPENFHYADPDEIAKTRIELEIQATEKIILNVGAMVERKNIHMLVEAMKILPKNYKLMLMGTGDAEYVDRIDSLIHNADLGERVIKIGYTPYPQVPIAYQSANLFVLPSSFEGLPKAVMEALACGTQVLAAGFNLKEPIAGLEYLKELTPETIAKEIQRMVENPQRVDVLKVVREHSWDVKANQVQEVYDYVKENFLK